MAVHQNLNWVIEVQEKLSTKVLGISLGALFSITYVVCILWDIAFPRYAMKGVWTKLLPGFTWLTPGSFVLGLVETFLYGLYIAVVFASIYNYLLERGLWESTTQ